MDQNEEMTDIIDTNVLNSISSEKHNGTLNEKHGSMGNPDWNGPFIMSKSEEKARPG